MTEFTPVAAVDGVVSPVAEASIPVMDRGFLYGDSIYEVFRTYRGVPLFFEEHWSRFENSASLIHVELGEEIKRELTADIKAAVAASKTPEVGQDVYVRYIVTRGEGPVDLLPAEGLPLRRVVIVKQIPRWNPAHYSDGAHSVLSIIIDLPDTVIYRL